MVHTAGSPRFAPQVLDAICEQSEVTIFNTSGRHGVRGTGTWYVASSSQGASGGAMAGPGKRRPLHGSWGQGRSRVGKFC